MATVTSYCVISELTYDSEQSGYIAIDIEGPDSYSIQDMSASISCTGGKLVQGSSYTIYKRVYFTLTPTDLSGKISWSIDLTYKSSSSSSRVPATTSGSKEWSASQASNTVTMSEEAVTKTCFDDPFPHAATCKWGSITYDSTDSTVASISDDGTVTIGKAGTATITASSPADTCYTSDNKSFTVTVNRATGWCTISPVQMNLTPNDTKPLACTSHSATVSWASENENIAIMQSDGYVRGIYPGSTNIVATSAETDYYTEATARCQVGVDKVSYPVTRPSDTTSSQTYAGTSLHHDIEYDSNALKEGGQTEATDVGVYTVTFSFKDSDYYNFYWSTGSPTGTATAEWAICVKVLTITWSNYEVTYTGQDQYASAKIDGVVEGDKCTVSVGGTAAKNVGDTGPSTASLSGKQAGNYKIPDDKKNQSMTINKANYTMPKDIFPDQTAEYNTQEQKCELKKTLPTGADNIQVTCTITGGGTKVRTEAYDCTATFATTSPNYNTPAAQTATITITKAPITRPTWDITTLSFPYDRSNHGPSITDGTGNWTTKGGTAVASDANNYSRTWKLSDSNNTKWATGDENDTITCKWSITQKSLTITWGTAEWTYNGQPHGATGTLNGVITGDACTLSYSGTLTNAGTGTTTASLTGDQAGNYTLPASQKSKAITVNALDISGATITLATSPTYTRAEQTQGITSVTKNDLAVTYTASGNKGTNVGAEPYTLTITGNGNFTGTATKTWNIIPKQLTLTWSNTSYTYDGDPHYATASISGVVEGDKCTVSVGGTAAKNVGDTGPSTASLSGKQAGNYKIPDDKKSQAVTISIRSITVPTWNTTSFTYNNNDQGPKITDDPADKYVNKSGTLKETNAKDYSYTWSLKSTTNTKWDLSSQMYDDITCNWSINKADYSTITYSDQSKEYNGEQQYCTVDSLPTGLDGIAVTVKYTGGGQEPNETQATKYSCKATFATTSTNYNTPAEKTASLTITRKSILIPYFDPENRLFDYDGTEHTPTLYNSPDENIVEHDGVLKATNVSTSKYYFYNNSWSLKSTARYKWVNAKGIEQKDPITDYWAILPKDIEGATITLASDSLPYMAAEQTVTINSIIIDGLNVTTYTIYTGTDKGTNAGSYKLEITGNGNFLGNAEKDWSITPLALSDATITLGTALTYNGQSQEQAVSSVVIGSVTIPTDQYIITDKTGTNRGNYTLTVSANGDCNVTGSKTKGWSIAQATPTITFTNAGPITKTYGDEAFTNAASTNSFCKIASYSPGTGFEDRVSISSAGKVTILKACPGSGLTITASVAADTSQYKNWKANTASYTLIIKQKQDTFTFTTPANPKLVISLPYSDTYTCVVAAASETAITYSSNKTNIVSVSGATLKAESVSTTEQVTITLTSAGNDNYSSATTTLTVATTTRSIYDASVTLGTSLTYNGSTQTQTISSVKINNLNVTYAISTGTNIGENAGSYTMTLTGSGNYSGTQNVNWSIAKRDLSSAAIVTNSPTYNGSGRTPTISSVKVTVSTSPSIILDVQPDDYTVSCTAQTDVNTTSTPYTLTITASTATNCNFSGSATTNWNLSPKQLTSLKWTKEWPYDCKYHTGTAVGVGLINPDTCDFNYTTTRIPGRTEDGVKYYRDSKSYNVTTTATSTTNANYSLPDSGTVAALSINQLTAELQWGFKTDGTIAWDTVSIVYDGKYHTPKCQVTNLQGKEGSKDTCTVTLDSDGDDPMYNVADTKTVTALSLSNDNYALPTAPKQEFSITVNNSCIKPDTQKPYQVAFTGQLIDPSAAYNTYHASTSGNKCIYVDTDYEGYVTPNTNYGWVGGGNETITFKWQINKITPSITITGTPLSIKGLQTITINCSISPTLDPDYFGTGTNPKLEPKHPSYSTSLEATSDGSLITINGMQVTSVKVGTPYIKAKLASSKDWNASNSSPNTPITITPSLVAVPIKDTTTIYTYNSTDQTYQPTNWSAISGQCNITNNIFKDAGTHSAIITLKNGNLTAWDEEGSGIAPKAHSWVINQLQIQGRWDNTETTFIKDTSQNPTYTVTNVFDGDTVTAVLDNQQCIDAGTYTRTVKSIIENDDKHNYTIGTVVISTSFVINKAAGTMTWDPTTAFTLQPSTQVQYTVSLVMPSATISPDITFSKSDASEGIDWINTTEHPRQIQVDANQPEGEYSITITAVDSGDKNHNEKSIPKTIQIYIIAEDVIYIKYGDSWKKAVCYIKTDDGWKQTQPYIKTATGWKKTIG